MARPRSEHPTPTELAVLKVLWAAGEPLTVRAVKEALGAAGRARAYTSVMTVMNTMAEKGLLAREARGRAFAYRAVAGREQVLAAMAGDLLSRAFEGSASTLVAHLLEEGTVDADELAAIRGAIRDYERRQKQ